MLCFRLGEPQTRLQQMQLEYFIIGGCTIQILLSHIKPRAVLALNIADVRKPALLLALFQIQKMSRLNELKIKMNLG